MEELIYSRKIFKGYFGGMKEVNTIYKPVIMEIGPGDSLFSMVYSRRYSNAKFYFIDVGDFVTKNLNLYFQLQKNLKKRKIL